MALYRYPVPPASEITPKNLILNRRAFMAGAAGLALAGGGLAGGVSRAAAQQGGTLTTVPSRFSTDEAANSLDDITGYCNFYEFGTGKGDPAKYADALTTRPWTVEVGGLVNNPGTIDIEDILADYALEDRIYRLRCVEGWSMVVPWVGIPLASVLEKFDVQGSAKYVAFETLVRPEEMRGQASTFPVLPWPYVEGLRMDEAKRVGDYPVEVDRLFLQLDLPGIDPRHVEHVADDAEQVAATEMDVGGVFRVPFMSDRPEMLIADQFGKAENGVQRGPQFMRHGREELRFGAVRLFRAAAGVV